MSFSTTKFQEILLSGFRGVALTDYFSSIFHFGQISKFKKGVIPRKQWNQNFLWICASKWYILHNNNLLSSFRGVALTNCFSSIFHFGQMSKFKKGVFPRKKMESKFPVDMHIYTLCPSQLQSFTKFYWAVSQELCWQIVSVESFMLTKFLS